MNFLLFMVIVLWAALSMVAVMMWLRGKINRLFDRMEQRAVERRRR